MFRILALTLACCLAGAAGGPVALADPAIPLTMAGAPTELPHWLPVYVARAKFFAEEGLDVTWVPLRSGSAEVAAVMGGSAQAAPVGVELPINSFVNGGDLVLISDLFDLQPYSVVLSNDAIARTGITMKMSTEEKLQHLKGLKIAITGPGSATDNFIRQILKRRNIDADSFLTLQPLGDPDAMLAALQRKLIDGFIMSAPADEIAEQRGIGKPILDAFSGELPELIGVPFAGIVTTKRQLASNPAMFQSYVNAIAKSIRYLQTNPADAKKLIRPYFADLDDPTFNAIFDKYRKAAAKSAVLSPSQYDAALRWANSDSPKPLTAPYDSVVDMSFATKAMASH
jgi:NitT/TauT family transport system substrate-binding protein